MPSRVQEDASTAFREVQAISFWWVRLLVALITLVAWWAFVQQIVLGRPWGTNPGPDWVIWCVFVGAGLLLPGFLLGTRLITEVGRGALHLHYRFLKRRTIPFEAIRTAEALRYHPILEYGGWGLRWAPGRGWAWTAVGNRGVRLQLEGGKTLLVGTQRPEELLLALVSGGVARKGDGTA